MSLLGLRGIRKNFGCTKVLSSIELNVGDDKFDVLVGHWITARDPSVAARAAHDTALHTGSPTQLTFAQADALLFDDTGRALRPTP